MMITTIPTMADTSDAAEQLLCGEYYNEYLAAMHLHGLGFSLIPISPHSKRPVLAWKKYQAEQCSTADVLEWFGRRGYRVGIVTGALSGIVVVDCDDQDAVDTLLDDTLRDGGPLESLVKQTTTRGLHLVYRHPGIDTRNGRGFLGAAIDVRGDGGYVLAYEDSGSWTRARLDAAPVYQPLSRETSTLAD